jgi:hypothetical protein
VANTISSLFSTIVGPLIDEFLFPFSNLNVALLTFSCLEIVSLLNIMPLLSFLFWLSKLLTQPLHFQVAKFKDARDACAAIVAESYRLWLQYETRTDDITVIVVHVNGLTDVRGLVVCDIFVLFLKKNICIYL